MDNMNNENYLKYLEMVQKDGLALKSIPLEYQTEELCMEAVKQNEVALAFIENQTPEMCLESVKKNGFTLKFVKNQTEEICMAAIKNTLDALRFVKNQTKELCLNIVKQNGLALDNIKDQTPEICLEAVKQNGWALDFVKNQTEEICLAAVKQDYLALSCIRNEDLKNKVENKLIELKLFKETNTYRAFITDGIDCDFSYISPKDNIERPATIVLDTKDNSISISFEDNKTKCNAKNILESIGNYKYGVWGVNSYAEMKLDNLPDDKISELFTDVIMKVDESVREHYDLSKNIKDKEIEDKNYNDMEL